MANKSSELLNFNTILVRAGLIKTIFTYSKKTVFFINELKPNQNVPIKR